MWMYILLAVPLFYYVVIPFLTERKMKKKMEKWGSTPKDLVILHAIRRGHTVSHPSPFVVKVETFLRMNKIRYETDFGLEDAWGPKGRFPWISINGEHIADSELIIQFLKKKFNTKLGANYSKEQLAVGNAVRVLMDDHFFWGLVLYRFVFSTFSNLRKIMAPYVPSWRVLAFKLYAGTAFKNRSKGHGIGLHSQEEITALTMKDLEDLRDILGNKKYILGDDPSEIDCTVFGHLIQVMWALPGSVYENALQNQSEFKTLKDYTLRMKETFYPDWDKILDK